MPSKTLRTCLLALLLLSASFPLLATPTITDVYLLGMASEKSPDASATPQEEYTERRKTIGINETVVVKLDDIKTLISEQCQKPPCPLLSKDLSLYVDGKKIAARKISDGPLGKEDGTVEFYLAYGSSRSDKPELAEVIKRSWASILGSPQIGPHFWTRPVEISIGVEGGDSIKYDKLVNVRRIDKVKFWIFVAVVGIAFLLPLLFEGARKKLRDALSDAGNLPNTGEPKPWSLARCQMAFWFVMVAISFVSIWVVTGALDTITGSVLALIGIGSGSALGSALIDASGDEQAKRDKLDARKTELEDIITGLDKEIGDIGTKLADAATTDEEKKRLKTEQNRQKTKRAAADALRTYVANTLNNQTSGFWTDLFNDGETAAFHRIQMFVWTFILGGIFVYSVWKGLTMPEFSETLLALQGISAGTYLGFKLPENKA